MRATRRWAVAAVGVLCVGLSTQTRAVCSDSGVQLQILGSGGPGASGGRASSGYIVWIDGVGRIMVDAGSGTKDQFYAAGASLEDVELFAISHFHPDHSAELPAILWPAGSQAQLSGPAGGNGVPSVSEFAAGLFGENGIFPPIPMIFGDRLQLDVFTVDASGGGNVVEVWSADGIRVRGTGVPHATVPTIAYRVDIGDASIAFSSDQNGSDPAFIDFVRGVDVLVAHMIAGEDVSGFAAQLHAKPSVWGQMASRGEVGRVVLSHTSRPSPAFEGQLDVLRANYDGPVTVGEDLLCVEVN